MTPLAMAMICWASSGVHIDAVNFGGGMGVSGVCVYRLGHPCDVALIETGLGVSWVGVQDTETYQKIGLVVLDGFLDFFDACIKCE